MKKLTTAVLIVFAFGVTQCKKNKVDSNGLPQATQEGKNTLGFLLNGQPWTPQGFNGTANLSIDFDEGFNNGVLGISAYRILSNDVKETFGIGITDSLNFFVPQFNIQLSHNSLYRVGFRGNCSFFSTDSATNVGGMISITKVDRTSKIIAGTFNATLSKNGCTTIKITEDRFDMKY